LEVVVQVQLHQHLVLQEILQYLVQLHQLVVEVVDSEMDLQ
jgi:hypothetical protein